MHQCACAFPGCLGFVSGHCDEALTSYQSSGFVILGGIRRQKQQTGRWVGREHGGERPLAAGAWEKGVEKQCAVMGGGPENSSEKHMRGVKRASQDVGT